MPLGDRTNGMSTLETILLLTDTVEQPVLGSVLRRHNPLLRVRAVVTAGDLAAVEPDLLPCARLVAFCSDVMVPRDALDRLGFGAYNFHPGSPQFPGWAPAVFAVSHRATMFGATAHVMTEKVDDGPIVGVEYFPVPANATVPGLEELAYAALARLFWQLAPALATQAAPLAELATRWNGKKGTRRRYAAMCGLPRDISKEELDRHIVRQSA